MLRVHLMPNWFALSDPAMEEALYEIASLRTFAGLGLEAIPDETTILNFRHVLEASDLAEDIFKQVNAHLARKGLLLKRGSIVDATIIAAPSSTKNSNGRARPRDASDEEGQPVVLRDEGAHRRRCTASHVEKIPSFAGAAKEGRPIDVTSFPLQLPGPQDWFSENGRRAPLAQ